MMTRTELQKVIEAVDANFPEWVSVYLTGNSDRILVEGIYSARGEDENHDRAVVKETIAQAKRILGDALQERFPERTFLHAARHSCRFWFVGMHNMGVFHRLGIVCGIRIKLSEEERSLIRLGAAKKLFA